ncbi:MAG: hypothetical protein K2Y18_06245 [Alphaproteobacteria bacterium]|jgi:hypothetical protein|nr:hypothetical protein [Alphaproteobacteria bacterium]
MIRKNLENETTKRSESEIKRIEKVCEQLLCFNPTGVMLKSNQEWIPAWSSLGLEQLIDKTLLAPDSHINDLFLGLWKALAETKAPLTETMTQFLLAIVRFTFTRYRSQYENEDLEWMASQVNTGCTEAQAYLTLLALPVNLGLKCKVNILKILENTDFKEVAQRMLSD